MPSPLELQRAALLRLVRVSGVCLGLLGFGLYFDVSGIASQIGVAQSGVAAILGPVLVLVGFLDLMIVPTILTRAWDQKK